MHSNLRDTCPLSHAALVPPHKPTIYKLLNRAGRGTKSNPSGRDYSPAGKAGVQSGREGDCSTASGARNPSGRIGKFGQNRRWPATVKGDESAYATVALPWEGAEEDDP